MNTKLERNIVYSLPLISIIFEIVRSFIDIDGLLAVRNYTFLLIMLFLVLKYFKYVVKLNVFLILLMVYLLLLLIIDNAELSAYNDFVIVFDAKMLLPLGFILTSSYEHIQTLNKKILITNVLFVLGIISFSIFGIGTNVYGGTSGFKVGYFIFGHIYIGSFLIILVPVLYGDKKNRLFQNGLIFLGVLTFLILVLSVRRTSIALVLIGILPYLYLYRNYFVKIFQYAFTAALLIALMFPLYKDSLIKQMEARARVFSTNGAIVKLEEETRLAETIAVWEERIFTHDFRLLMFGDDLFNSAGNYAGGIHKGRPLHLDFNVILHGSGVIGLLLLLLFYFTILYKFTRFKVKLNLPNEKLLLGAFSGMFLAHILVLFSGGLLPMTFNLMSYLYMGSILGLYRSARVGTLKPLIEENAFFSKTVESQLPINTKPYIYETFTRNDKNDFK